MLVTPMTARFVLVGLTLSLSLSGCALDLPDPRLVIKHRVLAIQTAVTVPLIPDPDPQVDALTPKAQALPFETVEITPFIVNPEGPVDPDSLDMLWIACELTPGQGLFACLQAAMPLTVDELPECSEPSLADLMVDELPESESPCLIAREGSPEYVVPLSANAFIGGSIELTMIAGIPNGTPTDTCAAEVLRGDHDLSDDCLVAVQRLSLGPIEQLAIVAESFGVELPGFEAPDPDDVPEPDRNPQITEIRVGIVADGEQIGNAAIIESGDVVSVPREAILQVEVDSPEANLQTYAIPVNNGESFEARDETYQGDWYRTWGTLLSGTSDDPSSYNQWTLSQGEQDEEQTPPGDRALIYYVVRDGRQGVNWMWFELQVGEPLESEP